MPSGSRKHSGQRPGAPRTATSRRLGREPYVTESPPTGGRASTRSCRRRPELRAFRFPWVGRRRPPTLAARLDAGRHCCTRAGTERPRSALAGLESGFVEDRAQRTFTRSRKHGFETALAPARGRALCGASSRSALARQAPRPRDRDHTAVARARSLPSVRAARRRTDDVRGAAFTREPLCDGPRCGRR